MSERLTDERITELCELPILILPEEIRSIALEIALWRSLGAARGEDPDILRDALIYRELRDSTPPDLQIAAEQIIDARERAAAGDRGLAADEQDYD